MIQFATIRRATIGSIAFLLIYCGSYLPLSMNGGWVVSESGKVRITLAMADIFEWQPRFGHFHLKRSFGGGTDVNADLLGWFYAPLIISDQKWIHPTITFIEERFKMVEPIPAPPLEDYHPTRENSFHGRFPYSQPTAHSPANSTTTRDSTS